jgi:hypothetical protein
MWYLISAAEPSCTFCADAKSNRERELLYACPVVKNRGDLGATLIVDDSECACVVTDARAQVQAQCSQNAPRA